MKRSLAFLAALPFLLLACGPTETPRDPEGSKHSSLPAEAGLKEVPTPDLSAAQDEVRTQLRETRGKLERALQDRSASPAAQAQAFGDLGLRYLIYDFLDAAGVCFENARTLAPEDFRWLYYGGYLHKIQGRLEPAIELLTRTLELEPELTPALVRLARARLERGEAEAARALFERALALDPASAAALAGLGQLASAAGETEPAIAYFEKALEKDPGATSLHYTLGQEYRNAGNLEQARYHLERRGETAVAVVDPLLNPLADLGAGGQFYTLRGQEALDQGDFETAAASFERAIVEDPQSFAAYRGLSYATEKLGNLEGAVAALRTALEKATTGDADEDREARSETHRVLGALVALTGDDPGAVAHFQSSLELDPEQPGVRLKLANALARVKRFSEAVTQYDTLLTSHPDIAGDLYVRRATALVNLNRHADAVADFERAVVADPENGQLRLRFAEALEFMGRTDAAAEQWAEASRLSGDGAERARLLAEDGSRLVTQGRFDDAVKQFRESLRLLPEQTGVRSELASVLGHLGRLEEAIREFRQVVEKEPRHAAARRGEILALLLSGRYGEARVRLQEALRAFPQDAQLAHLQARLLASVPDPRVRDGQLALEIARRLADVRQDLRVRETLAMALAEAGQYELAVEMQKTVVGEAEERGDPTLIDEVRSRLATFERRQAWTFSSAEEILAATMGAAGG